MPPLEDTEEVRLEGTVRKWILVAVTLLIAAIPLCGFNCETSSGSDVTAVIKGEEMWNEGGSWHIPVELTPSDAIELDRVHSVELLSAEGYSFGRNLVSWGQSDSRSIKEVEFEVPTGDKVGNQLTDCEREVWEKVADSYNPLKATPLYREAVGKIVKVRIRDGDVVKVKGVRTVLDTRVSAARYHIAVTLVPTDLMAADLDCWYIEVKWSVGGVEGEECSYGYDFGWSQSEISSGTAKDIEIGNLNQAECDRLLGGGSADFWSKHDYEVEFHVLSTGACG